MLGFSLFFGRCRDPLLSDSAMAGEGESDFVDFSVNSWLESLRNIIFVSLNCMFV